MLISHQAFPQDFQRLKGCDININEGGSGANVSANSLRPIGQEGAQVALLDTLFASCEDLDEQSMRTALGW